MTEWNRTEREWGGNNNDHAYKYECDYEHKEHGYDDNDDDDEECDNSCNWRHKEIHKHAHTQHNYDAKTTGVECKEVHSNTREIAGAKHTKNRGVSDNNTGCFCIKPDDNQVNNKLEDAEQQCQSGLVPAGNRTSLIF